MVHDWRMAMRSDIDLVVQAVHREIGEQRAQWGGGGRARSKRKWSARSAPIRTRYGNALLNAASALSATGVVHDDDLDPRSVLQRHRTGPRHLAGRERLT